MREEKKKPTTGASSQRRPLKRPERPREWPVQPPAQPSGRPWPTPIPSSTIDIGDIRKMLLQILGRLDAIEKRLDEIERILAGKAIAP